MKYFIGSLVISFSICFLIAYNVSFGKTQVDKNEIGQLLIDLNNHGEIYEWYTELYEPSKFHFKKRIKNCIKDIYKDKVKFVGYTEIAVIK